MTTERGGRKAQYVLSEVSSDYACIYISLSLIFEGHTQNTLSTRALYNVSIRVCKVL